MCRQPADIWADIIARRLKSCRYGAKHLRHRDCSIRGKRNPTIQPNEAITDKVLAFRCPYCAVGADFAAMTGYKDGRFVCRNCAHTLRPGNPAYLCACPQCLKRSRQMLVRFS